MRLALAQDLVRARCIGRCEGCGTFGPVQVHHRCARGVGGVHRAAEDHSNDPRNLLALCASCHAKTEHHSTWRECEELGWRVEHGLRDPWDVPALIYTPQGRHWWYLTGDGGFRFCDEPDTFRLDWREDLAS